MQAAILMQCSYVHIIRRYNDAMFYCHDTFHEFLPCVCKYTYTYIHIIYNLKIEGESFRGIM